ncbi:MAG: TonB-dependent receptor plug domain-containing protein, partial [Bacteroidia bacterium]
IVTSGGVQVGVGTTDLDGVVMIKPLAPGKYNVKAVYVGYAPKEIQGVNVRADKVEYVPIGMSNDEGVKLDEVQVVAYQEPLIDPDTKSGGTVTREEYQHMATKNVLSVASTTAGVYQSDEGKAVNVRGSRSGGTQIFIDGERAIGGTGIPQQGVEQVSVILGGLPAQYGDATGGVISITTRGPQPKFFGGVEAISSQLTDKWGYNFLGFSVGGPIWSKKDSTGTKRPIVGFFLAGEAVYQKDPDPSAVGVYKVKDSKLREIEQKPLVRQENGTYYRAGEYVTFDDMEKVKVRQNVATKSFRLSPKIDFKPTNNLNITIGGTWDYNNYHSYQKSYALFNPANNPQSIDNTMRGYIRFTQKFGNESASEQEKSQATIKNAYFTFQMGYQKEKNKVQDDTHKDKFFDYGYIGKFNTSRGKFFGVTQANNFQYDVNHNGIIEQGDTIASAWVQQFNYDSAITFSAGTQNPLGVAYTQQVIDEMGINSFSSVQSLGSVNGLYNGQRPGNIQGIWYGSGRQYGGYSITDNSQFRITSSFSADIKNHALQVGIEFDQRDLRGYNVAPIDLWGRMRQLANLHNIGMDKSSAYIYDSTYTNPFVGGTGIAVGFNPAYDENAQSHFSKVFYEQVMGLPYNSTDYIDVDAYDPSTYNINMLTPDELLNGGSGSLVDAFGYDYYGKRLKNKVGFDDFLTKSKTDRGDTVFDRNVGAFRPIYMAGYIQDKFDFKDIKFSVGVRIDRYDANQKVLKDKYLLKEAHTAGELGGSTKPGNISNDATVYVFDSNSSSQVVGYRDGDTWYDASGNEVADPKELAKLTTTGTIQPWLVAETNDKLQPYSNSAFKDYVPQINVMPRIAFSFPISDVANFFAHYDVLTQRPTYAQRVDPKDYYFLTNNQGSIVNNPNLKPEKTIDYELGFSQVLSEKKNAALKLTSFYREMRNMTQITRVNQAYPISYLSYGNIDFGTVKGFSVEYDLRRTGGISVNANYTLQFAEGSGSNANGGYNLASSSQPNLRVTLPLDFDQRHTFTGTIDYRFGSGKDYKGPKFTKKKGDSEKTYQVLKDVGFNFVTRLGSGTPYTRQANPTSDVDPSIAANSYVAGDLNGSRYPWQFRTDLRIDKTFELTWGKADGDSKKNANLNVYLQVLNLFNTLNVVRVHPFTGSPSDDGYLGSPFAQGNLSSIATRGPLFYQSYLDLYKAALNDPTYYNRPRAIRIGLQLDF